MKHEGTIWQRFTRQLLVGNSASEPLPPRLQRQFDLILHLCASFVALLCLSGILLALNYTPSSVAARDAQGRQLFLAKAQRTIVDSDGDTLWVKDHCTMLAQGARTSFDSTSFERLTPVGVQPSLSWMSVEYVISTVVPFGRELRQLHVWTAHCLMLCIFVLVLYVLALRMYRYSSESQWLRVVAVFVISSAIAWLGSLLPWNVRSELSLSVVGSLVQNYIPLVGDLLAQILRDTSLPMNDSMNRLFVLHAGVLPLLLILTLRGFHARTRMQGRRQRIVWWSWIFPIGSALLASSATKLTMQLPAGASISQSEVWLVQPEWYLHAPFTLLRHLPEDLAASIILLWLGSFILMPLMHARIRSRDLVSIIAWTLCVMLVGAQIAAMVVE